MRLSKQNPLSLVHYNQTDQMMNPHRLLAFAACLFAFHLSQSQVPDGGSYLNDTTGTTWQRIGSATATEVGVEGQDFSTAIRVSTQDNIVNSWDAQLKFPAVSGVEEGDVVLVAFYARTLESEEETGEGFLNVIIEHNVSYSKELSQNISIGNEWKEYYAPVVIGNTLALSQVSYLFHMGFRQQTVEVAKVRWLNYQNSLSLDDLPITETTYAGRDPDAPWREEARARIDRIRRGPLQITVVDTAGVPVSGAALKINMARHSFGFGTAVVASHINSNEVYRTHLFDLFNETVFENDLKWGPFLNESRRNTVLSALDTLDARDVPVRGHNIIWPSWRFMPDFMEDLASDHGQLRMEINRHIDEVTSFTEGRLNDWDVINEPFTEHDIQDRLGDEVMAEWFRRARRNDRGVKLYLNDYAILSGGGLNKVKQDFYYDLVGYIDSLGGEVQGIGFQGHFSGQLTSIEKVYGIVDRFSELGKDIKITEFDIALSERERDVQAEYTRDFMTILFSHPSVKGILTWGFWAGAHWKPDAAFFDQQWNLRPHGEMWRQLVSEQWWTPPVDTLTDTSGQFLLEGFLGTYHYEVVAGEYSRKGSFTIVDSFADSVTGQLFISLDPEFPEKVQIRSDREGYLCEGEEAILRAPAGNGLSYAWTRNGEQLEDTTASVTANQSGSYRVTVSKSGMLLDSEPLEVEVRALPAVSIQAPGEPWFCQGTSLDLEAVVSERADYQWLRDNTPVQGWDSVLTVTEGGTYSVMVSARGCTAVSESVEATMVSPEDERCATLLEGHEAAFRVFPNPCRGAFRLEWDETGRDFSSVRIFDATGRLVVVADPEVGADAVQLELPSAGLYLMHLDRPGGTVVRRILSL